MRNERRCAAKRDVPEPSNRYRPDVGETRLIQEVNDDMHRLGRSLRARGCSQVGEERVDLIEVLESDHFAAAASSQLRSMASFQRARLISATSSRACIRRRGRPSRAPAKAPA
jgi:hypothetical protein